MDQTRDREFPVKGMPNQSGDGFVDYVLWGDDGKPLAVIEAKRTKKDSRTGQQQAKLYADCLEAQYGRRPVMFTTNGYEHWLWDDAQYPPRPVSGFMKKDEFVIFDFCQNLEFFSENPNFTDGVGTKPMGERLFTTRVELIDAAQEDDNPHEDLVRSIKQRLQDEVAGMPLDNFIFWAKRRSVERFQKPDSWSDLSLEARMALTDDVAGLPSAFEDGALPAKQFDLLCLNAQLRLLQNDGGFSSLQQRIIRFASALEELENVPLMAKELELILEIQTDVFWDDVTVEILESVRKRLRGLAELTKPKERKIVITDFIDEIGESTDIVMPDIGSGVDKARFKMKVHKFVEEHRDHITVNKVKLGQQLTKQDLDELSEILVSEGVTDQETLKNLDGDGGLGPFLRSLTGLDRAAAKNAFGGFTTLHRLSADQTEFLDLIIDSLTEGGIVEPATFYESPFTDIDDQGIAGVFNREQAKTIVGIVRTLNESAAA